MADCQAECNSSSRYASLAVLLASTLLGLPLMDAKALSTTSPVTLEKSVPFGKNPLMSPFVFSTVPFYQGPCGRQKESCAPPSLAVTSAALAEDCSKTAWWRPLRTFEFDYQSGWHCSKTT